MANILFAGNTASTDLGINGSTGGRAQDRGGCRTNQSDSPSPAETQKGDQSTEGKT